MVGVRELGLLLVSCIFKVKFELINALSVKLMEMVNTMIAQIVQGAF